MTCGAGSPDPAPGVYTFFMSLQSECSPRNLCWPRSGHLNLGRPFKAGIMANTMNRVA
jgi:hypothetical protein